MSYIFNQNQGNRNNSNPFLNQSSQNNASTTNNPLTNLEQSTREDFKKDINIALPEMLPFDTVQCIK